MRVTYKAEIDAVIYVQRCDDAKAILVGDDLRDLKSILDHLEHVQETARELGSCELRFSIEPVDDPDAEI